jgi:anaplastic lymphoma kinase
MKQQKGHGSTPTDKTGPQTDHTYQNISGNYMFVNMNQTKATFASNAVMNSIHFNPPPSVHNNGSSPYRNSCMVRFYVHQYGLNAGSINLSVVEMQHKENITTTLWFSSKNQGEDWVRIDATLPNITSKYFLVSGYSNVLIFYGTELAKLQTIQQ